MKKPHRALVLGGGGAVGAYQAGVLKILCKRLIDEDKKKADSKSEYDHDRKPLLFDIIAGTSIGAMNGAVLLSQYLKTGDWESAAEQLKLFWTDKEKGLASTVSEEDLKEVGWEEWHKQESTSGVASTEAARRYYSVKYYTLKGAPKVQAPDFQDDSRFFDKNSNKWYLHKPDLLEKTILNFAPRKITTSYGKNQPRLLVFSVDAAEGKTVTFDSYSKADSSRKSGVEIDHVMASGTLSEFYDYKKIGGRKFWDGGLLSNTPFRELLQAHQQYWMGVTSKTKKGNNNFHIPNLEVYMINLHPTKRKVLPTDHDGVKDRHNDIIYGDRSSPYDEKMAYLVADLKDFATQMKKLSREAVSKVRKESDKKRLKKKFDDILKTRTTTASKGFNGKSSSTYGTLLKGQYKLTKVVRIERTERKKGYYTDTIYGKAGDFTDKTIDGLIEEGKKDAKDASLA